MFANSPGYGVKAFFAEQVSGQAIEMEDRIPIKSHLREPEIEMEKTRLVKGQLILDVRVEVEFA